MTQNIIEFLDTAARHYYNGEPIITDEQFDCLAKTVNYDTVGARQHANTEKHMFRMYSLQKMYEDEGTKNPLGSSVNVSKTPKLDGAALDILYFQGKLVRVLTRGDGIEGKNVTDKFLASNLIPHQINTNQLYLQVTGEIAAPKHIENARNYAAGALNLGSVEEFKSRAVNFFAYGVYPYPTDSFHHDMNQLEKWGFKTVFEPELHNIYPCDGLVFRLNNNQEFEAAGFTSKHPKGAYALKERSDVVETTLLAVEWGVGKSGKVTPVAILEPVLVGDATVSRATLNNPSFIEALDLHIGDRVAIRRAGMIIPEIVYKVEA